MSEKSTYCDWTSSQPVCGERATVTLYRQRKPWALCGLHAVLVKCWRQSDHVQRLAIVDALRPAVRDSQP
jgi:hypothetical protein